MAERKESVNSTAGREILITRLINAPIELVWEVWVNPEHIKNWWGPTGFTNTINKMEVFPGGIWELVMHGPDGTDYPNKNIFKEIIKYERIVYEHASHPEFLATINFTKDGKKTWLRWHMLFESKELFEQVVKTFKADEGLKQNIEKLEKYLSANLDIKVKNDSLTIIRVFNAPRELVFKAWTDPEHLVKWWGPKGFTNVIHEWNVQPGGPILLDMIGPDKKVYPMNGTFKEIIKPERLVFTSGALDAHGKPLFQVLNTISFIEERSKTKLIMNAVVSEITPQAAPHLVGMNQGWNESLDRLAAQVQSELLIIERTFNAPIAKVWRAITNREEMKQWYFDLAEFKPEVGFEFTFTGGKDGREFFHFCKITEVINGKKLTHSWSYKGFEGISYVTFELFAEGDKTRLKLTHEGLESFPSSSNPDFAKENFVEGWTMIIGKSLKEYLEK